MLSSGEGQYYKKKSRFLTLLSASFQFIDGSQFLAAAKSLTNFPTAYGMTAEKLYLPLEYLDRLLMTKYPKQQHLRVLLSFPN